MGGGLNREVGLFQILTSRGGAFREGGNNFESCGIRPWAQNLGFWLTRLCYDVLIVHNHESFCCDSDTHV